MIAPKETKARRKAWKRAFKGIATPGLQNSRFW